MIFNEMDQMGVDQHEQAQQSQPVFISRSDYQLKQQPTSGRDEEKIWFMVQAAPKYFSMLRSGVTGICEQLHSFYID